MTGYAVIVSQPSFEAVAAEQAVRQQFDVWFPRLRRVVSKRGKRAVVIRPLFPRYLFVRMTDDWRKLFSLRGVASLLLRGEKPAIVTDEIIDELKLRCDEAGFYRLAAGERFADRQSVTVKRGPFAGLVGLYAGPSHQREAALFTLLGSVRRIEFVHGDLIAA